MRHIAVRMSCALFVSAWALGGVGHAIASPGPEGPHRATPNILGAYPPDLVEIYYNSPGRDNGSNKSLNGEWFKFYDQASHGYRGITVSVSDAAGNTWVGKLTINPGASVKVHTGKGKNTATDLYWGRSSYAWNNTADTATYSAAGEVWETCSYDDATRRSTTCNG